MQWIVNHDGSQTLSTGDLDKDLNNIHFIHNNIHYLTQCVYSYSVCMCRQVCEHVHRSDTSKAVNHSFKYD